MTDIWLVVAGSSKNVGGVSSHVKALAHQLRLEGQEATIISPREMARTAHTTAATGLTHFHVSFPTGYRLFALALLITWTGKSRSLVTFHHGPAADFYRQSRPNKALLKFLFWRLGAVISLTPQQRDTFSSLDSQQAIFEAKSYVGSTPRLNDYVAPSTPHLVHDPNETELKTPFTIVTSGYESAIYGIEELVRALNALPSHLGVHLHICTYGPAGEPRFLDALTKSIHQSQISVKWFRGLNSAEFLSVLGSSNVYVRNTTSDSYGLTLAEALEMRVPTLATDVCERPSGVDTFAAGAMNDLIHKLCLLQEAKMPRLASSAYLEGGKESMDVHNCAYKHVTNGQQRSKYLWNRTNGRS